MKRFIVFGLAICALIFGMSSVSFAGTQSLMKVAELQAVSENNLKLSDSDELLTEFVEKHASEAMSVQSVDSNKSRGARLTGNDAIVYETLKKGIEKIAAGENDSSIIEVSISELLGGKLEYTAEDLGLESLIDDNGQISDEALNALYSLFSFDTGKVLSDLMYDMPYELYWFDKTKGYTVKLNSQITASYIDGEYVLGFSGDDPAWVIEFKVSRDYSKTGRTGTTDVDTGKTRSASQAARAAGTIVRNASDMTDLEKLTVYKEKICELTGYNDEAASDESVEYGDPWQLIYVFDGDKLTNVVCEGYSKAFQFLCDLSEFESRNITSYIVTGTMTGGTGAGGHMWNIVHMDDGKNYIADITNCDAGTTGAPDLLFLKGYTRGSLRNGYTFVCDGTDVDYQYDSDTRSLYDDNELMLSDEDYKEAPCEHDLKKTDATQATCTSDGNTAYWECSKCGRYFSDANGNTEINEGDWVIKGGHDYEHVQMKKATATAEGNIEYWTCIKCGTWFGDAEGTTIIEQEDTVIPVNNFRVAVKKKQYTAKSKKKTTIKGTSLYSVNNKKGKVTYKKASGKAKFTVSQKNGNIIVKKGLKKGTYVVKVKVTTAAAELYEACSKTVKVKIKVK